MNDEATKTDAIDVRAAARGAIVAAIAECIRELGTVPSGHLYAMLMSHLDLEAYTRVIDALKAQRLVRESGHELTWIGEPKKR